MEKQKEAGDTLHTSLICHSGSGSSMDK